MSWVNDYVGIPYRDQGRDERGCDCWGLARLIYGRELTLALPSYLEAYPSALEREEVAALITQQVDARDWQKVSPPAPFDLLLLRYGRTGCHVGVFVDAERFLHIVAGEHSKIARRHDPRWRSREIGAYRHPARCAPW